jgi:hypothetical protein
MFWSKDDREAYGKVMVKTIIRFFKRDYEEIV